MADRIIPTLDHLPRARLHKATPTIGCGRRINGQAICRGQFGEIPAPLTPFVNREPGIALRHGFARFGDESGLIRWQHTKHAARDRENRPRRTRQESWSDPQYFDFRDDHGITHRIGPEFPAAQIRQSAIPDSAHGSRRATLDPTAGLCAPDDPFRISRDHFIPARELPVLATCPVCGQLNIIDEEVLMERHSNPAS